MSVCAGGKGAPTGTDPTYHGAVSLTLVVWCMQGLLQPEPSAGQEMKGDEVWRRVAGAEALEHQADKKEGFLCILTCLPVATSHSCKASETPALKAT